MNPLPEHIAIIMDGNGRWAKEKNVSRAEGHWNGANQAEAVVTSANNTGIKYLTLYAFSDENWERPPSEISALMDLLVNFLQTKKDKMIKNGISFGTIGDISKLPAYVQEVIKDIKAETAIGKKMRLTLALSYGSKNEMCRAINRAIENGERVFTPEVVDKYLDTAGMPPPDLIIRTSGELRISNFLLWQSAYTEFYFTKTLWPDFKEADLLAAIEDYRKRERRFGRTEDDFALRGSDV